MKITRKFFSFAASLACFLLVLAALVATFGMQLLGDLKSYVQISLKNVQETTGYRITLDDIGWGIFEGTGIRVDNLAVYDTSGKALLLDCRFAHVKFDLLPLFKTKLIVSRIDFDEPRIFFQRDTTGAWKLPPLEGPAQAGAADSQEAFTDFTISLKRLRVKNGSIHIVDSGRGKRLDLADINLQVDRGKQAGSFAVAVSARQEQDKESLLAFKGTLQGITPQGKPEHLSASGDVNLANAHIADILSYLTDNDTCVPSAKVNARLAMEIEPDWQFSLAGSVDSDNVTLILPGGKSLGLGKTMLEGKAQVTSGQLKFEDFKLKVSDTALFSGKCSLTRMDQSSAYLELKCTSNRIPISLIANVAPATFAMPDKIKEILAATPQGQLEITSVHILTGLGQQQYAAQTKIAVAAMLHDVVTRPLAHLPPVKLSRAQLNLQDETLNVTASAQWPGADNHTLQASVVSVFKNPTAELELHSALSSQATATILRTLAPDNASDSITFSSGAIAATTRVSYGTQTRIAADIDLTSAGFLAAGMVEKPAGLPLALQIKAATASGTSDIALPVSFNVTSGASVKLDGTITSLKPFAAKGTYRADNVDLSAFKIPDIQGLMTHAGFASGSGDWIFPSGDNFPVQGHCSIKDFSLIDTANGKLLVGGSLQGVFDKKLFKVFNARAAIGDTCGALSGELTSIVPTRGRLDIIADLFDIDDFVYVIDNFLAVISQMQSRKPPVQPPAADAEAQAQPKGNLLLTDLDMPLTLKRLNLWNWDFDNGTTHWVFKNGVMNFDDIKLHGGGGPIYGQVVFDLSHLPVRTLTLVPHHSQSEFLFVVPALRKNRTITGTMDMSGYFSSTFARKEDLGRNMAGRFNVTITDGKLQKLTVLSKIMELMNLGHFFTFMSNDLLSTGMPYDKITADFTVDHAVMNTENLQLKGPAVNLSAVGSINMINEQLDMIIGAQVLETFGKIVGAIPIAGRIVTGKDKTITLAYFKVSGSYQDASVVPMPVKSLSAPVVKLFNSLMYLPKKLIDTVSTSDNETAEHPQQ